MRCLNNRDKYPPTVVFIIFARKGRRSLWLISSSDVVGKTIVIILFISSGVFLYAVAAAGYARHCRHDNVLELVAEWWLDCSHRLLSACLYPARCPLHYWAAYMLHRGIRWSDSEVPAKRYKSRINRPQDDNAPRTGTSPEIIATTI